MLNIVEEIDGNVLQEKVVNVTHSWLLPRMRAQYLEYRDCTIIFHLSITRQKMALMLKWNKLFCIRNILLFCFSLWKYDFNLRIWQPYLSLFYFLIKILSPFSDIRFIKIPRGKILLMVNGYTFYKDHRSARQGKVRWRCSAAYKRCRGYVVMSENDEVIFKLGMIHNHHPPNYMQLKDGNYIKRP